MIVAVELVLLVLLLESLVVLESTVSLLALEVAESLMVPVLLLVAPTSTVVLLALNSLVSLEFQVALESPVTLVDLEVSESLVVPVLLLVALESTVVPVLFESLLKLEVNDWIIASVCDSVETIDVALAILKVKELMEEEMVLEVVYYYLFAFYPKK